MITPERLDSGRWKVRFRHGISPRTGRMLLTSESFDTEREAVRFARWLAALGPQGALDKLYDGAQARVPSLDELAAAHVEHLTGVEAGTRLGYTRLWARTWGPLIGSVPADRVTRDTVAGAVNRLGERYSAKSLANQRGLLSGVLDRAVALGHLRVNPAKGIRLPRTGDEREEMVCLTLAEWDALYAELAPHYRPLARFLIGTGARWGEAVALRVCDVDLDATPVVRIRRALKWSPDGRRTLGPTKTRRSKRTVTLPGDVAADLRPLVAGRPGDALVFTAPRGGPVAHRTFWSDHWRPAIWRAQRCPDHRDPGCLCGTAHPERCQVHETQLGPCGCPGTLGHRPRIHDLRHTHASWLLARGVPIHVVQARLGHESIQTTVDTYGHLVPDAQLAAADAAERAFSPAVRRSPGAAEIEAG